MLQKLYFILFTDLKFEKDFTRGIFILYAYYLNHRLERGVCHGFCEDRVNSGFHDL